MVLKVHSNGAYKEMKKNPTRIHFCIGNEVLIINKKNNKSVINTPSTGINKYSIHLCWNKQQIKCWNNFALFTYYSQLFYLFLFNVISPIIFSSDKSVFDQSLISITAVYHCSVLQQINSGTLKRRRLVHSLYSRQGLV